MFVLFEAFRGGFLGNKWLMIQLLRPYARMGRSSISHNLTTCLSVGQSIQIPPRGARRFWASRRDTVEEHIILDKNHIDVNPIGDLEPEVLCFIKEKDIRKKELASKNWCLKKGELREVFLRLKRVETMFAN